jgi:hypothetical protein
LCNPQNTPRRRRRKFPGGDPDQQFGLLIEKLVFCLDGREGRERWRRHRREFHRVQRPQIWARFRARRYDPEVLGVARAVFHHQPQLLTRLLTIGRDDLGDFALLLAPELWPPPLPPTTLVTVLAGIPSQAPSFEPMSLVEMLARSQLLEAATRDLGSLGLALSGLREAIEARLDRSSMTPCCKTRQEPAKARFSPIVIEGDDEEGEIDDR